MRSMNSLKSGAVACAAALALIAGACNTAERDTMNQEPAAESPAATSPAGENANQPVTVTGCLQQQDGGFVLTEANDLPDQPIATSGEQASQQVQKEQTQAAKNSYRLDGGPDNMEEMVGNRVRVTGNRTERSDVASGGDDISASDLAEIEVTSVESVGETCGTATQN